MLRFLLLVLCIVGSLVTAWGQSTTDTDTETRRILENVQTNNRRYLKNLPAIRLGVFGGALLPPGLEDRFLSLAELRLRQSRIAFQTVRSVDLLDFEKFNSLPYKDAPTLYLGFNQATHTVSVKLEESLKLPRNDEMVSATSWSYHNPETILSTDQGTVADPDEASKYFDAAMTAFCDDYLAANPPDGYIVTRKVLVP